MSDDFFRAIESPTFAASVSVASSLRSFLRAVNRDPAFQALFNLSRQALDIRPIAVRLDALLTKEIDRRFQSPFDAAIAAYLWLLSSIRPDAAISFARAVDERLGDCGWWSRKIADVIEKGNPSADQLVADRGGPIRARSSSGNFAVLLVNLAGNGGGPWSSLAAIR